MERFGDMFKRLRVESKQTLRAFCLAHDFDAGNVSKIERGRVSPPESVELLGKYASALGLKPGSSEWSEFHDLAAAERGIIPPDLLEDADLLDKLPVLFRVLRGTKTSGDSLHQLVEKIRRA